jgi:hypothetical protein
MAFHRYSAVTVQQNKNKTVHAISRMHNYFCRSLDTFIMQINVTRWDENGCGQLDAL